MLTPGQGSKNRIELESQVLCAALRQSLASGDMPGALASQKQLCDLFPDLLPQVAKEIDRPVVNYYQVLNVTPISTSSSVASGYLRAIKKLLRQGVNETLREQYYRLLDAGFVLRKSRLRLSHDMVLSCTLALPKPQSFELPEKADVHAESVVAAAPAADATPEPKSGPKPEPKPEPKPAKAPSLLELMSMVQFISAVDSQAVEAKTKASSDLTVEKLVLSSGYVSADELNSLKLAQDLLGRGKISIAQFQVCMYDERLTGVRMAESLQNRGWLETEVRNPMES